MGEIKKQEISAVSEDIKQAIARKSAASLPGNPTEKGFKPQDIIGMLYKPIIDTANSAISEIDRVVKEANTALTQIVTDTNSEFKTRDNSDTEFKEGYDKTVEELKAAIAQMGINSITHIGTDDNGGNIYRIYYNSEGNSTFTAPKGDTGHSVVKIEHDGTDIDGGSIYKQIYTDGTTLAFTVPKGDKGSKGDKGDDLEIYQSFPSIAEMEAAAASIPMNKIILIATVDTSHEDNAKLFVRSKDGFSFLKKVDLTLRDIPLQTGETENSLVFSKGTAKGEHSIAGGTDSAEAIIDEEYLKSLSSAGTKVEFDLPQTEKPLSIAYGIGAKSKSTMGTAIGANVTSGVRGYYWWSVNGNTFELSTTRKSNYTVRKAPESLDWEKGDYICVVNKDNYPFVAQITSVDHTNKKITVDKLPDIDKAPFSNQYDDEDVLLPNDMTIFAVQRGLSNISGCYEFKVRSGEVELAWGAVVLGALSTGAGSLSFNTGLSNLSYDFGSVSGRENMGGYASLTSGLRNIDRGRYNIMGGRDNYICPGASTSILGGKTNISYADNVIMGGCGNVASAGSPSSILVGDGLKATAYTQAIFGRYNDPDDASDDLLIIGNGSLKDGVITKSNAFRVSKTGDGRFVGDVYSNGKKLLTADEMIDMLYPVGSVYISANTSFLAPSPASWLGGTWERIKDRFLLAAGNNYAAGSTGGSAHAVVVSHGGHLFTGSTVPWGMGNAIGKYLSATTMLEYGDESRGWNSVAGEIYPAQRAEGESGTGKNMPPYLVVYMWKRIA